MWLARSGDLAFAALTGVRTTYIWRPLLILFSP